MAMGESETDVSVDKSAGDGSATRKSRLVWLTGYEDLRIHDHGGFNDAFSKAIGMNGDLSNELIVPVFVIDLIYKTYQFKYKRSMVYVYFNR